MEAIVATSVISESILIQILNSDERHLMPKTEFSIAVMGAGGVDQTQLVLRLCRDTFDDDFIPEIRDYYEKKMTVDGIEYLLKVYDTVGADEMQGIIDVAIGDSDAHVIVYSVISQVSFNEADKYREKVKNLAQGLNIVLCGNKCEQPDRTVTEQDGREKAASWGCPFFETSSRDNINVYAAFEAALKLLLSKPVAQGGQSSDSGDSGGGGCCNVA
jgi:small GTP-binding protein